MTRRGVVAVAGALLVSAALLAVQLAAGGARFVPAKPADPCAERAFERTEDLERLAEIVVLAGLDGAACELGVSRERFVLAMPSRADRAALARERGTDEAGLARAIEAGLLEGVDRLDRAGRLPSTDVVLDQAAERLGVPQGIVDLVPDALVDRLPSTASLLRATVRTLDVPTVLDGLDAGDALGPTLRDALVRGALDAAEAQLRDLTPGPLQGLLP